jgi:hypothetical protein
MDTKQGIFTRIYIYANNIGPIGFIQSIVVLMVDNLTKIRTRFRPVNQCVLHNVNYDMVTLYCTSVHIPLKP